MKIVRNTQKKAISDLLKVFMPDYDKTYEETVVDIEEIICQELYEISLKINHGEHIYSFSKSYGIDCHHKMMCDLYDFFEKIFSINPKWGILTGIRPSKLYHKLMMREYTDEEIIGIMRDKYRVSREKSELLIEICKLQKKFLFPTNKSNYSIYVGIPFCPSKCSYCSFSTFKYTQENGEQYTESLVNEINFLKSCVSKAPKSVYIGGGTPSMLSERQLNKIFNALNQYGAADEVTFEAGRPELISRQLLDFLKKSGVTRISVNPQSMNDETLLRINRNHTVEDVYKAYELCRNINFESVNMDLIIGLEKETNDDIIRSVNKVADLEPDNITVHNLSIKKGSDLSFIYSERLLNQDANISDIILNIIREREYHPYYLYRQKMIYANGDNIGFSKLNRESLYNISMMEDMESVIGFGLGASSKFYLPSKDEMKHHINFKSLRDYIFRQNEILSNKALLFSDLK